MNPWYWSQLVTFRIGLRILTGIVVNPNIINGRIQVLTEDLECEWLVEKHVQALS